ncbi:hypothetical protein [Acidiferrobacter sp.]|uniref:hypothetical protein n=1 Tax=Acidiferrobacter sp. TaxID=1872107 RepID=UPI00261FEF3E|nr:hypothetical protein [Acidiferrobacter sp.]
MRASSVARILRVTRLWQAGDRGQGIRVGVISGGARNFLVLAQNAILPADVALFGRGRGDEGDWMMQVVHDIAPDARLAFCPGGAPRRTVACARDLIDRFHAAIIVDDINPQPVFFAPTAKAQGYARLLRHHPQVLFLTGAGNNGGGYYQGAWRPRPVVLRGRRWQAQTFGPSARPYDRLWVPPGAEAIVLLGTRGGDTPPGGCAARGGPTRLIVTNRAGRVRAETLSDCPLLQVRLHNDRARLARLRLYVVRRHRAWPGGAIKLVAIRAGMGISPLWLSVHTEGGAGNSATDPGLMAVAAIDPASGDHGRYLPEPYANGGPQCGDFGGDAAGGTGGFASACIRQPVFAAPDRTLVAMPAASGRGYRYRPFTGDSAAGPAAAGVAALLLAAHAPPQRIESLLKRTARPQGAGPGWAPRTGYGLIDADAAAVAAHILAPRQAQMRGPVMAPRADGMNARRDQRLLIAAREGDKGAARALRRRARAGDPIAQSLLGTLYNRGWGVDMDPRAAHAWWTRAAHAGVTNAIYNLGITWAIGRGATADPRRGYALMRAAELRGLSFPPMERALRHIRALLSARAQGRARQRARVFAADPAAIP